MYGMVVKEMVVVVKLVMIRRAKMERWRNDRKGKRNSLNERKRAGQ